MDGLRTTHESQVTEDQIDHLGHMNVAFYAVNAQAGTRAVLAELPAWGRRPSVVDDVYTRHHREQLLGTPLAVRSAVLGVSRDGLRLHHELVAVDSGVLAATFVHGVTPLDESGERAHLPDEVVAAIASEVVAAPDYAATRTLSLDHDPMDGAPSLATVRERGLAMRKERRITPAECDDAGRYRIELAPMLTWGGEPLEGSPSPIHEDADGVRMGWASMETRIRFGLMPRVGARIQSFGAAVAIHDKVTHRVHWTFDLDSETLLTAFEAVSMAFDIAARRPMRIPEAHRRRELEGLQPDLAPGRPD
jgi:acyl-CoA thioesterase FadM